jgi:hypothetical protein
MVSDLKGTTYQEKCKELGLNTLLDRREAQDMSLWYQGFGSALI